MTIDPDRRSSLLAVKLGALARAHGPVADDARPGGFPDGATLFDPVSGRCWVLATEDAARKLGGALAVAVRAGARELHVVVDDADDAGVLARRAAAFRLPVSVWRADGRELVAVEPAAPPVEPVLPPEAELYRPVLVAAGLDAVVDDGELIGELHGLEVARVVVDPDGSARLEAGVGRFDREAGAMMFAELAEVDSLARTIDIVARYRRAGVERHPLNQLVTERWLRSALVADPAPVGAVELRPVTSTSRRRNLTEDGVATAVGVQADGSPVVVVCAVGAYLDLAPTAADDRATHAPGARLVVAVPERDVVPITTDLLDLLAEPADLVAIPDGWRHPVAVDR